jgi:hypothetical protein
MNACINWNITVIAEWLLWRTRVKFIQVLTLCLGSCENGVDAMDLSIIAKRLVLWARMKLFLTQGPTTSCLRLITKWFMLGTRLVWDLSFGPCWVDSLDLSVVAERLVSRAWVQLTKALSPFGMDAVDLTVIAERFMGWAARRLHENVKLLGFDETEKCQNSD